MANPEVERIRAFLKTPGVTKRFLCHAARIGRDDLRRVEDADWKASDKTMRLLALTLDRLDAALA